jgi:purine catabolism regulator
VIGLIFDRDGQLRRRAAEVHQELIQLAVQETPMQTIAQTLANAAGRVVYLEDEYGVLQVVAAPSEHEILNLPPADAAPALYSAQEVLGISTASPASSGLAGGCIRRVLDSGHAVYSAPISLGATVAGFLTLLGNQHEMQDLDEQIVVGAASAFAFPIAKQRAIVETQLRLQGSFLESLFSGALTDEAEIAERARYLGHNLREPYDTVCITLDGHHDGRGGIGEAQRAGVWSSFVDLARREFLERWPRSLLRERGDLLAILVPSQDGPTYGELRSQVEETRVRLSRLVGEAAATVGMGSRASGPRAIVQAYSEAEQAARIGRQFLGGGRTVTFEELGVYRVIAKVEDRETLEAFRREYLGAIEEYDTRHASELADTLEGFFSCNGNHARAAETMHLHRNTLLYRLERIEALSGRDLSDPETRLAMHLALKIRRVFPTIVTSQPRNAQGGQR